MMELVWQCCRKGGIEMFIKEICQLCGDARIVKTDEKIGSEPRWEEYKLHEFGIESPYDNYEINICGECHKPFIESWDTHIDEDTGEQSGYAEYDMDALHDAIIDSLKNPNWIENRWVCRSADCDAWGEYKSDGISHSKQTGHSVAFEGDN